MNRLLDLLRRYRIVHLVGALLLALLIFVLVRVFGVSWLWPTLILTLVVSVIAAVWLYQRRRARKGDAALSAMFQGQGDQALAAAAADQRQHIAQLREHMLAAIRTIQRSRLGQRSGRAALYELPWYVVIGNPAAGKSSAIVNSGLNFPFSERTNRVVHGMGGTRNCDWFFTTEGILLDTAGRYSVEGDDRREWLSLLDLLRRHRPRAPINGIVIVANIDELLRNRPEDSVSLAKKLRARVQEITERLELFCPVYVVFTKVDLIAGFVEFFADIDEAERERVWGATLPYDATGEADAVAQFDQHMEALFEGLQAMSTTRMALARGSQQSPELLTFPLEFAGVQTPLRNFIATLFEENPYQFKPVFRGFYFTSALQEGEVTYATRQRVLSQFHLAEQGNEPASVHANAGFFLRNLFSGVIFADHQLVRQYASRTRQRLRYASFFASLAVLGLSLGAWGWSYAGNRQFVANVRADLEQVVSLQRERNDLASRLEALEVLQDRIEQIEGHHGATPWSLGFGLYQGERVQARLREEYFKGVQQVMLNPVSGALERYLEEVNRNAAQLQPATQTPEVRADSPYTAPAPASTGDAYNALKTYLMLASHQHLDGAHLKDQLTRFWRGWLEDNRGDLPREQLIRRAGRLIDFYVAQVGRPDLPVIENRLTLVDQTRENLRAVVKGMGARERVFAELRTRANTRYPAVTVASLAGDGEAPLLTGSHAVPGAFTREAWEGYVESAIREAATQSLRTNDWVLKTSAQDDLSLEGSPEQIQKELLRLYKTDYVAQWQQFLQGVAVREFSGFDDALEATRQLSDPTASPLHRVLTEVHRQTAWDTPALAKLTTLSTSERGLLDRVLSWFGSRAPSPPPGVGNGTALRELPAGPLGKAFAPIAALIVSRSDNNDRSLLQSYLDQLRRLHGRLAQIHTAGDIGPASRQLLQATLDGNGSELADALKLVDDNLLAGMPEATRRSVRPLLVRPLLQSFAVLVGPTETELNRVWAAQVLEPFNRALVGKYPFNSQSRVEATATEIAQVFGPDGAIAHYAQGALGTLANRRGDTLSARTWGELGIRLNPGFADNLSRYVAPLGGVGPGGGGAATSAPQSTFELRPVPSPGLTEYTVEIDGQVLRYRNGAREWSTFVWPNPRGQPGARVTATSADGIQTEILSVPGQFGLERLISAAQKERSGDQHTLSWENAGIRVSVNFRLISSAATPAGEAQAGGATLNLRDLRLPPVVVGDSANPGAPT